MALAMLIVVQINWAAYHTTLLRSNGNIGAVSRWFFMQGIIGAVLGLILIRCGVGVWGLLWGWTTGTVVAFVWTRWEARHIAPLGPLVSGESARLLRIGFPMFFFNASALIIRSLDRLIILRYLGTRELGYYSLAVTAVTLLMYLPDSATYVFYPRLLKKMREGGDRPELIQDSVIGVLRILMVLTPALGGLAFLGARDLLQLVLPTYMAGATAVRVMCFTAAGLCISTFASIVLMTLGRQVWLMPAAVLSVVAFAAADIGVLRAGYNISGVAWATFTTYLVSGFTLMTMALAALRLGPARVVREVGGCAWSLGAAIGFAFLIDRVMPGANSAIREMRLLHVALGWVTFLVVYPLAVAPQLRGLGMRQLISEFNLPFASLLRRGSNGGGSGS
jgi:O-antigen/teichoic acid export membrane protein